MRVWPWVQKILWRTKWLPTPLFLPGKWNAIDRRPWQATVQQRERDKKKKPATDHKELIIFFWTYNLIVSIMGEGNGTPLQYSCLENPMDGGAWWAAVHGVAGSRTWLSDFTFTFHFHALEREVATHSSVLAWRIPGTVEPGGLLSMGSHSVGHDWSDLAAAEVSMILR